MRFLIRAFRWTAAHTDEGVLLFIAVFLFFVATNTQTGWLFVVSAVIGAVLVMGWAGPRSTLKGLSADAAPPAPVPAGDKLRLSVRLHNPGRSDRNLLTARLNDGPAVLVPRIPARGSVTVELTWDTRKRGVYPLPRLELYSATPFGLFAYRRELELAGELVIYPRGPRLDHRPGAQAAPRRGYHPRTFNRTGASYDLRRIRPYEQGEDTRRIHWASSARTGQLMLREFQDQGSARLNLVLLNGAGCADEALETAVMAAASVVEVALREGIPLRLLAAIDTSREAPRPPMMEERVGSRPEPFLDLLARVRCERLDSADLLDQAAERVELHGSLFLLAPGPLVREHGWFTVRKRRQNATLIAYHGGSPLVPVGVKLIRHEPDQLVDELLEALRA